MTEKEIKKDVYRELCRYIDSELASSIVDDSKDCYFRLSFWTSTFGFDCYTSYVDTLVSAFLRKNSTFTIKGKQYKREGLIFIESSPRCQDGSIVKVRLTSKVIRDVSNKQRVYVF